MKLCLALVPLAVFAVLRGATPVAVASSPQAGTPTITIVSPHNGDTIKGSTVSIQVQISNFKLVPPVYINPPKLSGNQGHIHYVLDSLTNFVAQRDAKAALTHSWTNVNPGKHVLIAYLATSQHAQFPGTQQAKVTINVVAASSPTPPQHTGGGGTTPPQTGGGVTTTPASGGAAGAGAQGSSLNLLAILAGLGAILLGMTLRYGMPQAAALRTRRPPTRRS